MSKPPITHVLMLVDDSGSMNDLAKDTRGGFNAYVEDLHASQVAGEGRYRLTAATFGARYEPLCVAAKLRHVPKLTTENYHADQASTALFDAIGTLISDFERATPKLADGERVLLVVQTDGAENASREYTGEQIKSMITRRESGGRWAAIFLAAGPEAWRQGAGMGFAAGNVLATASTPAGTRASYTGLSGATRSYAGGATGAEAAGAAAAVVQSSGD